MLTFPFSSPKDLIKSLTFITSFDSIIQFTYYTQSIETSQIRADLVLTPSTVPAQCFTKVCFQNSTSFTVANEQNENLAAMSEKIKISWLANGVALLSAISAFREGEPFTLVVPLRSLPIGLLQKKDGEYATCYEINCLYDLGPRAEIDSSGLFYLEILDVKGFREVTKSLSLFPHEMATLSFHFHNVSPQPSGTEKNTDPEEEAAIKCELVIKTEQISTTLYVGKVTEIPTQLNQEHSLLCHDLVAFGNILNQPGDRCQLFIGVETEGLSGLRFEWWTFVGKKIVELFFL